ncbi:MAG: VCBS repeat-containing protein [Kofleriaceae bacterium]|nr:VCBS repeat-containing protein [Kofleriaceae bacterium]
MKAMLIQAALGAVVVAASAACTEFAELPPGQCGNGVVDLGEECDRPDGVGCGAVGTAAACRLTCDVAAAVACPDAYVCGGDGVCRQPSGQLVLSSSAASEGFAFGIGEVDGDGRPDLYDLGFDRLLVRRGDGAGGFSEGAAHPTRPSFGLPALGDLNDDGRHDMVSPAGLGLQTLLTDGAGGLDPYVYFSLELQDLPVLPIGIKFDQNRNVFDELILVVDGKVSNPSVPLAELLVPGLVPGAVPELTVPRAFLDRGRGGTIDLREEFVLAQLGDATIRVIGADAAARPILRGAVTLPGNATVSGRVELGFFDADDCYDLIAVATAVGPMGDVPGLVFASGVPSGLGCTGTFATPDFLPNPEASLLALADFNQDGISDPVGTNGVFMSCIEPACACPGLDTSCQQVGAVTFTGWTAATVGDVNRDGCLDLVAADAGVNRLDVRLGSCGQSFNQFTVPTQAPVRRLLVGDFDGDRIDDAALLQDRLDPLARPVAELAISYGRVDGGMTSPVALASFAEIESISQARILTGADTSDAIDDLLLVGSRCADDGCQSVVRGLAILTGASSRSMSSPLVLAPDIEINADEPVAALIGQFDDGPGGDVLALTIPDRSQATGEPTTVPYRLWSLAGDGRGNLTEAARLEVTTTQFAPLDARFAVAELDGDGGSEVVGIDTRSITGGSGGLSSLVRIDPSGDVITASLEPLTTATTPAADALLAPSRIAAPDLDGDGRSELLVTFAGLGRAMVGTGGGVLAILRAGATGAVTVEVLDRDDDGHACSAAVALQLDLDPELEVLATCSQFGAEGFVPVWRTFQRGGDGRYAATEDVRRDGDILGTLQLEVADLDGDGLDDVVAFEVLVDEELYLRVYRQAPAFVADQVAGGGR